MDLITEIEELKYFDIDKSYKKEDIKSYQVEFKAKENRKGFSVLLEDSKLAETVFSF